MAKATVTKIGLQTDTTRTVYATWTWDKLSQTDKYDVRWYYATGDGVRFIGSEQQVTITNAQLQSVYTAPEHAKLVKFQVKPIAKKHTVNKKEVAYWTAEWSTEVQYKFPVVEEEPDPPTTPSAPTVTMDKYTLTASLTNLDSTANKIEFQVVKDDTAIYKTGTAVIITRAASFSCNISAGSQYKVRCRALRGNETSEWSDYSANVSSIADAPSYLKTCYATSSTSVYLSWPSVSSADTYDIQYANEEEYLGRSNACTTINGVETSNYTVTGMETGQRYYFRVRAVNAQGASAWTDPDWVVLGTTPAAPTTWSSTTTAIVGEEVLLQWIHNSEDGSNEYWAEISITVNGSTYTDVELNPEREEEVDNTNSYYTLDTSDYEDGAVVTWKVRTAGITKKYGDWSMVRTINVYAPPTLELYIKDVEGNDTTTVTSFPFVVEALAGPSNQTPIGYHVSITSNVSYETLDSTGEVKIVSKGDEVYSKFYDVDTDLLLHITAGSIDLENNASYSIFVTVTMNTGLTTLEHGYFRVAWADDEYEPNAEIGYDSETLSTYIRPYCEDADGNLIEDITLSVYRREYDGRFVEIGSNLKNTDNTFVTDPHPSLDYARYRIVAITESTGAISYTDLPGYPINEKAVVIQWDETWRNFDALGEDEQEEPTWSGSMLKLPYNIDVSDNNTLDVTFIKYIGRSHPVSYYGTQVGSTATWNVDIDKKDKNTLYALRRLAIWMGDVYVREPSGSGYWANVSVSFSQTHCEVVIPVSISITRVEGGI